MKTQPGLFLILISFLFHTSVVAQTGTAVKDRPRFGLDVDAGMIIPLNKDVREVFSAGWNSSLGFKAAVLNRRLWIKAAGGWLNFSKQLKEDPSISENFSNWKAGLELQYVLFRFPQVEVSPFVFADQNWCANYFSQVTDYNYLTQTSTVAKSKQIMKGGGISYGSGVMVRHNVLAMKVGYMHYNPEMRVSQDIINQGAEEGIVVPFSHTFDFSSITISLSCNLEFKSK